MQRPSGTSWVRREVAVQAVAYVGTAAAVAATFVALGRAEDLTETGALLVMLAVAAVLLLAGLTIGSSAEPAYGRMQSVLWFGSVQAWAFAIALFVGSILRIDGRGAAVLAAALLTVGAAPLWWFLRRTLQQLALYSALAGLIVSLIVPEPTLLQPPDLIPTMLVLWLFGGLWTVLGLRGAVAPPRTAMVLGSITAIVAPLAFTDARLAGEVLSLATAAGVLVLGERLGDRAVAGLGIVGVLVVSAVVVVEHLDSTAGTIGALVVGVAMLFGALLAVRAGGASAPGGPPAQDPPPPPAGA